ncbi:unnamed protein product [Protopolystoma xenopodis]|uniref:Uncharacterized protein n=1 Tax=Protopolystoma xenopodis TaxID=117903 RepID=A0A3S5BAB4_9PLAT|nr:unnamed protein product [Protopolystoma xenopodis]
MTVCSVSVIMKDHSSQHDTIESVRLISGSKLNVSILQVTAPCLHHDVALRQLQESQEANAQLEKENAVDVAKIEQLMEHIDFRPSDYE